MSNKILTTEITGVRTLPLTKDSLDFLQNTYLGDVIHGFKSRIQSYTINTVYRVTGFDITADTGTEITFTDGILFYNDEFFSIVGATVAYADTPIFAINTAYAAFDPTEFRPSGTGSFNVHEIRTIEVQDGASGTGIADVVNIEGVRRTYLVEIGTWNMNTQLVLNVPVPAQVLKGKGVIPNVTIIDDSVNRLQYPVSYYTNTQLQPSASWNLDLLNNEDLSIIVETGTHFQTQAAFSGTTLNRGFVEFQYTY